MSGSVRLRHGLITTVIVFCCKSTTAGCKILIRRKHISFRIGCVEGKRFLPRATPSLPRRQIPPLTWADDLSIPSVAAAAIGPASSRTAAGSDVRLASAGELFQNTLRLLRMRASSRKCAGYLATTPSTNKGLSNSVARGTSRNSRLTLRARSNASRPEPS